MNAFTNYDETGYHYSFPVNRLELWAYLESERFLHPVMRQFYKERNVVMKNAACGPTAIRSDGCSSNSPKKHSRRIRIIVRPLAGSRT